MLPALIFASLISFILLPVKPAIGQTPAYYHDQVAVLMYHHIHEQALSSATIKPALFASQLEALVNKGYQFISLSDLQHYLNGATVPDNAVLVTFDDGYESFYTDALPILTRLKIPTVNYIITNNLNHRQETSLSFLTSEQIATIIASSKLVDFGCHTDNLHFKYPNGKAALTSPIMQPDGSEEANTAYQERIAQDTQKCIEKLAQNRKVNHFAYPYGIYNKTAVKLISQAGIQYAFTTKSQMTTRQSNPMLLPRINAGSPWITPQKLDFAIKQKIEQYPPIDERVPLNLVIDQINGGSLHIEGQAITLRIQEHEWLVHDQSSTIIKDQTIHMQLYEPIIQDSGRVMMNWRDLESIIGEPILYHPASKRIIYRNRP